MDKLNEGVNRIMKESMEKDYVITSLIHQVVDYYFAGAAQDKDIDQDAADLLEELSHRGYDQEIKDATVRHHDVA